MRPNKHKTLIRDSRIEQEWPPSADKIQGHGGVSKIIFNLKLSKSGGFSFCHETDETFGQSESRKY